MKRKSPFSERLIAVILMIFAIAVYISVGRLVSVASADQVGPKLFPSLVAIMLAVISVMLFLGAAPPHTKDSNITWLGLSRRLFPFTLFLVVYLVALPMLGFLITTTALLAASFALLGERRLWLNLLVSVCCTGATYLLFATVLGIQLTAFPG